MKSETTTRSSRQFLWLTAALLGLLITQITGCSSVPEGSPEMKQQALSFAPPPGKANIYVVRPFQFMGGGVSFKIDLDYEEFGVLDTSAYLFAPISPGIHSFRTTLPGASMNVTPFTVEAGKNYYFKIHGSLPANKVLVDPISETDGQAYVRKFKLSDENRFELQNQSGQTK